MHYPSDLTDINYQIMSLSELNNQLVYACANNNTELLKFLLYSPDLLEHPDIHYKRDEPFKHAVKYNSLHVLEFLIFEYEIDKTISIKSFIANKPRIQKMFEVKQLSDKLDKNKNTKIKRNKI